MSVRIIVRKCS